MSEHVIVGAGAVGSATALLLAGRGEQVRVISRRGTGPQHAAIERVAADATDAERLTALATGAAALYNCANPLYHQWFTDWPPLASALLTAAERSGAVLATMSNLYGYGPVDGPITQKTPLAAFPDAFVPLPDNGFLVTEMGSLTGGAPGRVAEFNAAGRLTGMFPADPPSAFNPHGISARPDLKPDGDL